MSDICTHALDDDGTPLDDSLVQVEHILNNLWERRQGVRALVAGAGSRVFADCLRKTIMSRAAETVPTDPNGPAATMDRSFLLHHIASSFVGMVQWWAWHNFQAPKEDVAKDYLSAIRPPLQLSKKLIPKHHPNPGRHASQNITRASTPPTATSPSHPYSDIYVGLLVPTRLKSCSWPHGVTSQRTPQDRKNPAARSAQRGSFMSEDALGSYPMRTADNYVTLD